MSGFIDESFICGAVAAATSEAPKFLCDRLLLVGMRRYQPNALHEINLFQ